MARTVLITGAAGFAGAHITRALLERGDSVVALDLAPSLPAFITKGIEEAAVTYVVGDATDSEQLATLVREADVQDIVHSAAAMGDRDSLERPLHFLRVNAEAVWGLCDVARRLPVRRLVCMSSRSVYGEYDPRAGPVAEDAAPRQSVSMGPQRPQQTSSPFSTDATSALTSSCRGSQGFMGRSSTRDRIHLRRWSTPPYGRSPSRSRWTGRIATRSRT